MITCLGNNFRRVFLPAYATTEMHSMHSFLWNYWDVSKHPNCGLALSKTIVTGRRMDTGGWNWGSRTWASILQNIFPVTRSCEVQQRDIRWSPASTYESRAENDNNIRRPYCIETIAERTGMVNCNRGQKKLTHSTRTTTIKKGSNIYAGRSVIANSYFANKCYKLTFQNYFKP